ncbi:hypothetical protein HN51_070719 [Arachis hypogaea]
MLFKSQILFPILLSVSASFQLHPYTLTRSPNHLMKLLIPSLACSLCVVLHPSSSSPRVEFEEKFSEIENENQARIKVAEEGQLKATQLQEKNYKLMQTQGNKLVNLKFPNSVSPYYTYIHTNMYQTKNLLFLKHNEFIYFSSSFSYSHHEIN